MRTQRQIHKTDEPDVPRLGWSSREVAAAFGCSENHIKNLMQSGVIPSVRLGKRRVVLDADLRKALEERVQHGWEPKRKEDAA